MQAFAVIAASPLRVDLSCVLEHVIAELTAFLRKVCNSYHNNFINLRSILLKFLLVLFEVNFCYNFLIVSH